ncbi:MAG: tRNA pseudouridine(38-40) synthase TruA [Sulfurovum sp.]|nr:tRNA pseudouridine(38-40) synthase TruA [Sulfurovum sp.]
MGEGEDKPTIQASIQKVLQQIYKSQDCIIATASRTDAGVHAQGQVIKISIPLDINSDKLHLGMNSLLPDDIRILDCKASTQAFNPNKDSKSKEYHYYFCTDIIHNPLLNDTVAHIPSSTLDIARMKEACTLFVGEHDFYSFAKRDSSMVSTLRTVVSCEIVQTQTLAFSNEVYALKIVGEGFLRYMVRYMAGALFALGRGELSLEDISEALAQHKEEKLSARAKSRGLHLIGVHYNL